ncbi:hypothetical protein HYW20_03535 [Candidatus Woesearchaeota archaeon]|nr:hypothetical protein [Candidatus Woesearchaeota archaeon]
MTDEAEGKIVLQQIRQMSQDLLEHAIDIDNLLADLHNRIKSGGQINKEDLLNSLNEIRFKIGVIEREDTEEMQEEEILENMIAKINSLIKVTFG